MDPVVYEAVCGPIFHCAKCGTDTDLAADDPADTRCEKCCEDHDYRGYKDTGIDFFHCLHCGKRAPEDFADDWNEMDLP